MQFDSLLFVQFLFIIYLLHRSIAHQTPWRESFLLICSYLFYMAWDWRFSGLILFSSLVDYFVGLQMEKSKSTYQKRTWLSLSLLTNLGLLFTFKYYDFFILSFNELFFGGAQGLPFLNFILPVGISFYTFQSMSYSIDLYRGDVQVERNLRRFLLFVSFFPQLVAGPIVKAKEFLPQLNRPFQFNSIRFSTGLFFILMGYFKKVILSDGLSATLVDRVFKSPVEATGWESLCAMYGYSFQIFCDFSGYSNIAIGLALLFGFHLPFNFNSPYIATHPKEFWKRWHISLSTWIRDYLYIPLGGNRKGAGRTGLNLLVAMFLGGLWHGAQWTFVVWGLAHGSILMIYHLKQNLKPHWKLPSWLAWLLFFHFVVLTFTLFRAQNFSDFHQLLANIKILNPTSFENIGAFFLFLCGAIALHFFNIERQNKYASRFAELKPFTQSLCILALSCATTAMSEHYQAHQAFIYFQF